MGSWEEKFKPWWEGKRDQYMERDIKLRKLKKIRLKKSALIENEKEGIINEHITYYKFKTFKKDEF